MTQQEVIRASSSSSSLLAISVRKSDSPIILLFSGKGRYIINSVNKPTLPSQANVILPEDDWYILSSIAGCTLALMVKRFSAMLASKSTYTIRNEWKQFSMNGDPRLLTFATVDERVLQFDWWGRRYSWGHPRGLHWYHGTAEWTEEGVVLCPWYTLHCRRSMKTDKHNILQTVCLSLIYSLTILELRPCKDSASCSLWCEKETSSVAASNIYRSRHSWTHNTTKTDGSKSGALLRASQVCCWCCGAKTARCSGHQSSAVMQRNVSLPVSCVTRWGPVLAVETTGWKNRADVRFVF